MKKLERVDEIAIIFLKRNGPYCIGALDTEGKMAAAIAFDQLKRKGRAVAEITDDGPSYRLTPLGLREFEAIERYAAVPEVG